MSPVKCGMRQRVMKHFFRRQMLFSAMCHVRIGIIGRKPEIKYHALQHAKELVPIQRKIVENAEKMVKPRCPNIQYMHSESGRKRRKCSLFCRTLRIKTRVIKFFLPPILCNRMTAEGMLTMIPGLQRSDGFFVARLRKTDR